MRLSSRYHKDKVISGLNGHYPKEAQALARHSTPDLTLNTYARTREDRLSKLTEEVGNRVLPSEKCALYVHLNRKRAHDNWYKKREQDRLNYVL